MTTQRFPLGARGSGPVGLPSTRGRYGAMTGQVQAFLAELRRVPMDAWRQAAETDRHMNAVAGPSDQADDPDRLARARLRQVMDTMPDVVRRIRGQIDGEMSVLDGIAPPPDVARMRRAARLAACSLAARPQLSPEEFDRLYRPFTSLIPPDRRG